MNYSKAEPEFDLTGYPALLGHILNGQPYYPLLQSPDVQRHKRDWRSLICELSQRPPKDHCLRECFHTRWTESHPYIRQLVGDDALLMGMLWSWLPPYVGSSMQLYRGENIDRFQQGVIGTAWSKNKKIAEMFAYGLNARDSGGVVLETNAPPEAIIAGPSRHSIYLGEHEYAVDWRKLNTISRT